MRSSVGGINLPREGGADSRGGRCYSVAAAEEVRLARGTVTESVSESDELTATEIAQSNNEAGPRKKNWQTFMERVEHLHAMVRQRKNDSDVWCNLKTMNEQQHAMLRNSGKQLC